MVTRCRVVVLALLTTAAPALGAVDGKTTCREVRAILDASPPDRVRMVQLFRATEQLYEQFDRANVTLRRPAIYGRQSKEGKLNTVAMATVRCENDPDETLEGATLTVYRGIEAIGDALGVNR